MGGALGLAAAILLVASGWAKLRTPGPTRRMLAQLVGPLRPASATATGLTLTAGLLEIVVGAVFICFGDRLAAIGITAAYFCFTAVALVLLRRADQTSCGCFGRSDTPVGLPHLALDVVATLAGVAAVLWPVGPLGGFTGAGAVALIVGVTQASLLAALGLLGITALPELNSRRRGVLRQCSS